MDLGTFVLAGHSLGGAITWRHASDLDRATPLVIVDLFSRPFRRYPVPSVIGRVPGSREAAMPIVGTR